MSQKLTSAQRKFLKGLAHAMDPAVIIGKQGMTEAVVKELRRQLKAKELIKVRIEEDERDTRKELSETVATESESHLVETIGKITILFRQNEEKPVIKLPK